MRSDVHKDIRKLNSLFFASPAFLSTVQQVCSVDCRSLFVGISASLRQLWKEIAREIGIVSDCYLTAQCAVWYTQGTPPKRRPQTDRHPREMATHTPS